MFQGTWDANGVCQPTPLPAGSTLNVADAATYPYSSSIPASVIQGLNPQLANNLDASQIPQINGNSVLAFMLGWGAGEPVGTNHTVPNTSLVYAFDGTNWNLQTVQSAGGFSGFHASRVSLGMIHGGLGYRMRRGW
jgi:hypothetical protein